MATKKADKVSQATESTVADKVEISVEDKLKALYLLQQIDTKIDKIRRVRGELPMEVRDLEDELAGLETRVNKLIEERANLEDQITNKKNLIKDAQAAIKKYEQQQANVKNNREFESFQKEIEYQQLEIKLAEKHIREFTERLEQAKAVIEKAQKELTDRTDDLKAKKEELDSIIAETQAEEQQLQTESDSASALIEDRLYNAYKRIRNNARNGLAVVTVQRDSCGGCFNKIPPQQQLDIRQHKKVIVCEHCGRILVDNEINN